MLAKREEEEEEEEEGIAIFTHFHRCTSLLPCHHLRPPTGERKLSLDCAQLNNALLQDEAEYHLHEAPLPRDLLAVLAN